LDDPALQWNLRMRPSLNPVRHLAKDNYVHAGCQSEPCLSDEFNMDKTNLNGSRKSKENLYNAQDFRLSNFVI
jgi:hypothetical protein